MTTTTQPDWRKPAGCESAECVEVAVDGHGVRIRRAFRGRDGKPQTTLPQWFSQAEWDMFIAAAKAGQYDRAER